MDISVPPTSLWELSIDVLSLHTSPSSPHQDKDPPPPTTTVPPLTSDDPKESFLSTPSRPSKYLLSATFRLFDRR